MGWQDGGVASEKQPQPEYTVHPGNIMIKFTAPAERVIFLGNRVTEVDEAAAKFDLRGSLFGISIHCVTEADEAAAKFDKSFPAK